VEVVIVTVVIIGTLLAIASGAWVAIALISAIFTRPGVPTARHDTNEVKRQSRYI